MRALALAKPIVNSSLMTCLITMEPIKVNFDPCCGSDLRPDHISLVQYGTKLKYKNKLHREISLLLKYITNYFRINIKNDNI